MWEHSTGKDTKLLAIPQSHLLKRWVFYVADLSVARIIGGVGALQRSRCVTSVTLL